MSDPKKRYYLYAPASDPIIIRVIPQLAKEIGLNESLLLLQIDFWIKNTDNYQDGKFWTYQSLRDIKEKAFDFWSLMTIKRTIDSLVKQQLIFVANYNKHAYDKTRWFALNPEALRKLPYIQVTEATIYEPSQGGVYQNDTGVYQNDTTIPENTTIEEKEKTLSPATQDDSAVTLPITGTGSSESVTPATVKKTKRLHTAAIKNELLPILIKYGKGRAMDSYTPSELTTLMRTGMAQILTELQPLDDESPIDAMELDAAFKWFRKQYKNASYPCGSKTVVKMLADYRAYKRSLQVPKPHIATPALDGLLAQPAPTYADSIDITDVRMMGETE